MVQKCLPGFLPSLIHVGRWGREAGLGVSLKIPPDAGQHTAVGRLQYCKHHQLVLTCTPLQEPSGPF